MFHANQVHHHHSGADIPSFAFKRAVDYGDLIRCSKKVWATSASTSAYLARVAVSKNDAKKRATDRWGLSIVGEIARMISEREPSAIYRFCSRSSADFHRKVFRSL